MDGYLPRVIAGLPRIRAVAAGGEHALLLSEDGRLLSLGRSRYGQLGHGVEDDSPSPRVVAALQGVRVCAIAAGQRTSIAVSADGTAFGWGQGLSDDGDPVPTLGLQLEHDDALEPVAYEDLRVDVAEQQQARSSD